MNNSLLDPERIDKRLERRAGRALGFGTVHLARDRVVLKIGRADQRAEPEAIWQTTPSFCDSSGPAATQIVSQCFAMICSKKPSDCNRVDTAAAASCFAQMPSAEPPTEVM